jgi:very-short-patch-repair endonuclease
VVGIDAMLAGRLVTHEMLERIATERERWPGMRQLRKVLPKHRVGVEYEGDHHRSRYTYQQDLRRINALHACGWTVLRFGAADVYRRPDRVIATVRAALAAATSPGPS